MKKFFRSLNNDSLFNRQVARILAGLKNKGNKKSPSDKNRLSKRQMQLEALEDRVLLAVTDLSALAAPAIVADAPVVNQENALVTAEEGDPVDVVVSANTEAALRDAINLAGTEGYTSTITFADGMKGKTITLSAVLSVSKSVTIDASSIANADGTPGITIKTSSSNLRYVLQFTAGESTLDSVKITGNSTGVYNRSGATLHVVDSLFQGCSAMEGPGAITNAGTMTIANTDILQNIGLEGGGIQNSGTMTIDSAQISGNYSDGGGGGIRNTGNLRISSSLVSGNTSTNGAGIYNSSSLTTYNVTIAGNIAASGSGAGVYNTNSFTAYNTLVLKNYIASNEANLAGGIANNNSMVSGDAGFKTFANQGWNRNAYKNWDFNLVDGFSAAVNSGNNANAVDTAGNALTLDFGGQKRIYGDVVDMGAYEFPNDAPTDITITYSNAENDFTYAYLDSGMTVGFFDSVDEDGNWHNEPFSYQLVAGEGDTNNGLFSIDGDTLYSTAILDEGTYSIRVQTADYWGLTYEKVFSIEAKIVHSTIVTSLTDVTSEEIGEVTLREAISYVGTAVDEYNTLGYNVRFANGRGLEDGTVELTQGEIVIDQSIIVDGGELNISVKAAEDSRVFALPSLDNPETEEVEAGVVFELQNITLTGGKAAVGGALYIDSGSIVTIDNAKFRSNSAIGAEGVDGNGGAIFVASSNLTIVDSSFTYNKATNGGAIFAYGSVVDLNGVKLVANSATVDGGGAAIAGGSLTIAASQISANKADRAAGLGVLNANASISGSSIYNNVATVQGGGIGFVSDGETVYSFTGTNCYIFQNEAKYGGGFISQGGTVDFSNLKVYQNTASAYGGGFGFFSSAVNMNRVNAYQNEAIELGGAAFGDASTITTTNSAFVANVADMGAGYYNKVGTASFLNCTIAGNAANIGGGVYTEDGTVELANSIIASNDATISSAEIFTTDAETATTQLTYSLVQTNFAEGDSGKAFAYDENCLIDVDPLFQPTLLGGVFNANLTFESPAQGAGSNELAEDAKPADLSGRYRIVGYNVDMGAYEYVLRPDLTYYVPEGWAAPVTISNVEDDYSNTVTEFVATETTYFSVAFMNDAQISVNTPFEVKSEFLVDGVAVGDWGTQIFTYESLRRETTAALNFNYPSIPAGTYTLRITLNASGSFTEEKDDNNVFETAQFTVVTEQLATPENFTLVRSGRDVVASWDAVENAESYVLQVAAQEDFSDAVEYVFTEAGSHVDSENFAVDTLYYARVQAVVADSGVFYLNSDYTETLSVIVDPEPMSPVVTTLLDVVDPYDQLVSIREAIQYAYASDNISPTVTFAEGLAGTITLTEGQIELPQSITIDGSANLDETTGYPAIVLSANDSGRIFFVSGGTTEYPVSLKSLRVTDGLVEVSTASDSYYGGAIYNKGNLALDFVGVTSSQATYGGAIYNAGTLSIKDSHVASSTSTLGAVYNSSRGTISVVGGMFANNAATTQGGAIYNNGTLDVSGTAFDANTAPRGGAIVAKAGTTTITDSTFTGNTASYYGGAIYNTAVLSVVNGTFTGNNAYYGGAINNANSAELIGGTISENTAINGAAVFNSNNGETTIDATTIANNTASSQGGVYVANGNVVLMNGATLQANDARYGGGAYVAGGTLNVLSGSNILANTALYSGGGIYNAAGLAVNGSTIDGNSAVYGGGVYNKGEATFENAVVSANDASTRYGGGVYNNSGTSTFSQTLVAGNTAYSGGGVYVVAGTAQAVNSIFAGNKATYKGGALYIHTGIGKLTNSTVAGNVARYYGGGIYNARTLEVNNSVIAKNTTTINRGKDLFTEATNNEVSVSTLNYSFLQSGNQNANTVGKAYLGENNVVNEDPLFAAFEDYNYADWTNDLWNNWDFDLQAESAAIGAASLDLAVDFAGNALTEDFAGQPRTSGDAVDMGAYERAAE